MAVIRNKSQLQRQPVGTGAQAIAFLRQLAPELEGGRGELVTIEPGGELEWQHGQGSDAFFLSTQGSVEVELQDRRETLRKHSLLWLEPGDRVVLRNPGQEPAELFYLESWAD